MSGLDHRTRRPSVHTWTVRCPRCQERDAVEVALYCGEANDYDGIRCFYCGEIPEADKDAAVDEAVWMAQESARSRDVN